MGHGRAIINIEDQTIQLDIYEKILSNKLSVRETEALVRNFNDTQEVTLSSKKGDNENVPKFIKKGITAFSEYFGHKIDVKVSKNGKGKITIPFHSEEDFNRIKKLVQGAK
jgi:ParB family chromosome partitioning protein